MESILFFVLTHSLYYQIRKEVTAPNVPSSKRHLLIGFLCGVCTLSLEAASSIDLSSLSLDELMSVEVTTPGKVPEQIRDTPASVYLVGRSDIERQGHSTLTEVFENVPGFYNIDPYISVSGNFGIRGFWNPRSQNSSVAILVNGIRQTWLFTRSHPMAALNLPVEAIDRVEITRGPNSVIYGNGASFGAINIITNESFHKDQFLVSYGSLNRKRSSMRWSRNSEDAHVTINASFDKNDGYDYKLRDLMRPETAAAILPDPELDLRDRLEQEMRGLQITGGIKNLYFDYSYNESDAEFFLLVPAIRDGSLRNTYNSRATIGFKQVVNGELDVDTKITYSDHSIHENYDAPFPGFFGTRDEDFNAWVVETLLNYVPNENLNIVSGLEWQRMGRLYELTHVPLNNVTNEVLTIDNRTTTSLFTQLSANLSDKIRIVGGVRLEDQASHRRRVYDNIVTDLTPINDTHFGSVQNTTPRVSLIYQLSDSKVFKLMAGDAIKLTTEKPDILPSEKYRTVEANYIFSHENILFSASLFRNSMKNHIIETLILNANNEPIGTIDAGGEFSTIGFEFLLKSEFGDHWQSEIGVTWQDSENETDPSQSVPYSPEFVSNIKLIYKNGDVSASLLTRYVDSMYPQYDVAATNEDGSRGAYIGDKSPAYFVADLSLRWDNLWNDTYLSMQATNIFDSEIRYPNNTFNSQILDRGTLGAGRGIRITAGTRF